MPGPATTDGDFYGRSDAGPLPLHAQLGAEPGGRGLVARPRYRPGVLMSGVGVGRLTWTSSHLSYGASGTWPEAQARLDAADFLVGYHEMGQFAEPDALLLAPLMLYLSYTRSLLV